MITRLACFVALAALLTGCATTELTQADAAFIDAEIQALADDDQHYDHLVINGDPQINEPGFYERKDQLQIERTERVKEIFAQVGYPAPPRFNPETASDFWLLVQHSDNDPAFQQNVLDAMDACSAETASPAERAYLIDRIRTNTGRPQVYGTQVEYDFTQARAFPEDLESPRSVDQRRASVGLEPLAEYMNTMSQLSFDMNRAMFESKGITAPWVYPPGFSDW